MPKTYVLHVTRACRRQQSGADRLTVERHPNLNRQWCQICISNTDLRMRLRSSTSAPWGEPLLVWPPPQLPPPSKDPPKLPWCWKPAEKAVASAASHDAGLPWYVVITTGMRGASARGPVPAAAAAAPNCAGTQSLRLQE